MLLTGQRGQAMDLAATVSGEGVGRAEDGHVKMFSCLILVNFENEIGGWEEYLAIVVGSKIE